MKKKLLALALTVALLVCCVLPAFAADYDINTAKESVVRIVTHFTYIDDNYPALKGQSGYATSTGFCIGDINDSSVKYIVTAGHSVCRNAESGTVTEDTVDYWDVNVGGYVYPKVRVDAIFVVLTDYTSGAVPAHIAAAAEWTDLAILELNTAINVRKPAVLIDKKDNDFKLGEELTAMGFPAEAEMNQSPTVSGDLLSNTNDVVTYRGSYSGWTGNSVTQLGDQISTDANFAPGLSGGPLVDKDGYVVGVCQSVAGGTGYAIATDEVVKLLSRVTQVKYTMGPLKKGLSMTMIIIIAAAALIIIALVVLIIVSSSKKSVRVLVIGGVMGGKTIQLKKGAPVVIGRDPNRCQVVYPKDTAGVSSVHCTITYDGNEVTVADNGSSYGTFVGGQKVEPGRPMVMHRGQEVTFGSDKNSAELH